jgi:hypothetical protein
MQRLHNKVPLCARRVAGVRATVILLVTFSAMPATVACPKQPIDRIPLVCGRLGVRKPQVHS